MAIVVYKPSRQELQEKNVFAWPVWEKEVSEFDWYYDETEECYILEGEIEVLAEGKTVRIVAGDFVRFPKGLSCVWKVKKPVRKHYRFA